MEKRIDRQAVDFLKDIGIMLLDDTDDDLDLRDYILESIDFIKYVIAIEDYYKITFPDTLLNHSLLCSSNALDEIIISLIEEKKGEKKND